jgi:hypothetical protein
LIKVVLPVEYWPKSITEGFASKSLSVCTDNKNVLVEYQLALQKTQLFFAPTEAINMGSCIPALAGQSHEIGMQSPMASASQGIAFSVHQQ